MKDYYGSGCLTSLIDFDEKKRIKESYHKHHQIKNKDRMKSKGKKFLMINLKESKY